MKLANWLETNEKTQKWLADEVGVSQGRISQVACGGTDSLSLALQIERATGGAVTTPDLLLPNDAAQLGLSEAAE